MDQFELLCTDGQRANVMDYRRCNLAKVPTHAVMTRPEKAEKVRQMLESQEVCSAESRRNIVGLIWFSPSQCEVETFTSLLWGDSFAVPWLPPSSIPSQILFLLCHLGNTDRRFNPKFLEPGLGLPSLMVKYKEQEVGQLSTSLLFVLFFSEAVWSKRNQE